MEALDGLAPELARWLDDRCVALGGGCASHDDVFFFFESRHPEALDRLPALFLWISRFVGHVLPQRDATAAAMLTHEPSPSGFQAEPSSILAEPSSILAEPSSIQAEPGSIEAEPGSAERAGPAIPDWVPLAVARLEETGDLAAVAAESGLRSPVTLLYWKNEHAKRELQREHERVVALDGEDPEQAVGPVDVTPSAVDHQAALMREDELVEWLQQRQQAQITRKDVLDHIMQAYPAFAAAKTPATLKTWTSRFLKRHIGGATAGVKRTRAAKASSAKAEKPSEDGEDPAVPRKRKGACGGGYTLHSNEFKLNALRKLDEGKSVSEVAQELGLKSQNSLTYWNSIRDKLATSEKKRFRLAGGGRRSSCTFEGELLLWVSERHQKGLGTDVKAVLDYMHEFHPSFTEGKKEPTLRKWILRFFKRCWRAPPTVTTPQDATKAYIFV